MTDTSTTQNIGNYSVNEVLEALRVTLEGTVVHAFTLNPKERSIVSGEINKTISSLKPKNVDALPLPVESELKNKHYTMLLNQSYDSSRGASTYGQQASSQDWAEVLNQLISETFNIEPFQSTMNLSNLEHLMRVVMTEWKKQSDYLPSAVIYVFNANKYDY